MTERAASRRRLDALRLLPPRCSRQLRLGAFCCTNSRRSHFGASARGTRWLHLRESHILSSRRLGGSLPMIAITVAVLSVVLPVLHLFVSKEPRTKLRVIHILLLYALVLDVGVIGLPLGFVPTSSSPTRPREPSAGRREVPFSSRSASTTERGAYSASSAFGLAAHSGSRPGSVGRSSCSARPTGTSATPCLKGLRAVQLPDDLLRRLHCPLAACAALALLARGRLRA